jgi:phospholipid/cholesterol/gamma-HCH transport system substrate-binding protein
VNRGPLEFIHPRRRVGQVPLGRLTIALQIVAALAFLGYTLTKKSIRLPGSSAPYEVEVEFTDAKGLDRVDEPGAAVAGALVGRVTGTRYEAGHAVATLSLDPDVQGKIFADATAELRPASAIQNLIVNIDPGTPSRGPLPADEPIRTGRTSAFVSIDELTGVLDADTRAYAQILVGEAERGLRGRGGDLSAALPELADVTDEARPISRSLATRRRLLTRLVDQLDTVATTLGDRSVQLGNAVAAGSDTLAVTAARDRELARATTLLAPALHEADRSLDATADLAQILLPALNRLVPVAGDLGEATAQLRALLPKASQLVGQFDALTKRGAEPSRLLLQGTQGLRGKVERLIPTAEDLVRLARILNEFRDGGAQLADTLSGATSVNDNGGAYGQVDVLELEDPKPGNLGLPASAARARDGHLSAMDRKLSIALEETCKTNEVACILRFLVPGLPQEPLTTGGGRG